MTHYYTALTRTTKQLRNKQAKSCCPPSETVTNYRLISDSVTSLPNVLQIEYFPVRYYSRDKHKEKRGEDPCKVGAGEDGKSWRPKMSNRVPRPIPCGLAGGLEQGSGGVVSQFVYSWFYPWLLRVKSENCLWVIVKTALKREVTSRES